MWDFWMYKSREAVRGGEAGVLDSEGKFEEAVGGF